MIIIGGHAKYDNIGKDIVCASISTLDYFLYTYLNTLENKYKKFNFHYEENSFDEHIFVFNKFQHYFMDALLNTIIEMFNELKDKYPENVAFYNFLYE